VTSQLQSAQRLIDALQAAAIREHGAEAVDLLETHISWILLAGPSAFKFKKPVDLGFVDATTLEKRRLYCHEELRLNRRLAPDLYLDVVAITGSPENPRLGGDGPAIEYAVQMQRFSQEALLSSVLDRGELQPEHIDALARQVADFHSHLESARPKSRFGNPEHVLKPVRDNFMHVCDSLKDEHLLKRVEELRQWSESEFSAHREDFAHRKQSGSIRECHGDMHLGNIVLLDGRPTIFDCIDFNEDLRWIDVISEVAFASMDLEDRGRADLGRRFLNAYLEQTGDYNGLAVLRFYLVYRAMVRAKVASLRARQILADDVQQQRLHSELQAYLQLAQQYSQPGSARLMITHGVSGTGKTHGTQVLVEHQAVIRIRSDVERKRMLGFGPLQSTDPARAEIVYSTETTQQTYSRLRNVAGTMLQAGHSVVVDAAFLKRGQRDSFRALADEHAVPFRILDFRASAQTLEDRVSRRLQEGTDASEADLAVLAEQLRKQEPLQEDERAHVIEVDSESERATELLRAAVERI